MGNAVYSSEEEKEEEMRAIQKSLELNGERFDFNGGFILGILMILIGFLRVLYFPDSFSLSNILLIIGGWAFAIVTHTWIKTKKLTQHEEKIIKEGATNEYEIETPDLSVTDGYNLKLAKDKEKEIEEADRMPDVRHKEDEEDETEKERNRYKTESKFSFDRSA